MIPDDITRLAYEIGAKGAEPTAADRPTTCYRFSELLAITKQQEATSNG